MGRTSQMTLHRSIRIRDLRPIRVRPQVQHGLVSVHALATSGVSCSSFSPVHPLFIEGSLFDAEHAEKLPTIARGKNPLYTRSGCETRGWSITDPCSGMADASRRRVSMGTRSEERSRQGARPRPEQDQRLGDHGERLE